MSEERQITTQEVSDIATQEAASYVRVNINGNVVSPSGASMIFGATGNEDNTNIGTTNEDSYSPYSIVILEEDADETIPGEQITFSPGANSHLTSSNVNAAVNELEQVVYNSVPVFTQEVKTATANQSEFTLTKTFVASNMMVFYNGLLINNGIHYSFSSNKITLLDFTAENGDILTVIGLAASNGNGGSSTNVNALIQEAW